MEPTHSLRNQLLHLKRSIISRDSSVVFQREPRTFAKRLLYAIIRYKTHLMLHLFIRSIN